jgi:hypothetical protein
MTRIDGVCGGAEKRRNERGNATQSSIANNNGGRCLSLERGRGMVSHLHGVIIFVGRGC